MSKYKPSIMNNNSLKKEFINKVKKVLYLIKKDKANSSLDKDV